MFQKNRNDKRSITYAFIDSQNLNLGTSKDVIRNGRTIYRGWKLDFAKFKKYLVDKYRVDKLFLFIGYIEENSNLYKGLESYGYTLVYKPTVSDGEGKAKGNVDAELVLHASAVEYRNYHKAVIVSGDGDFRCLHEYLMTKQKLMAIIIPNKYTESSLLKNFAKYKVFLNRERRKLEYRDGGGREQSKQVQQNGKTEDMEARDKEVQLTKQNVPSQNKIGQARRIPRTNMRKFGNRRSNRHGQEQSA